MEHMQEQDGVLFTAAGDGLVRAWDSGTRTALCLRTQLTVECMSVFVCAAD